MSEARDQLLARLTERGHHPRPSGDGWSARCPAHDDKHPSLMIHDADQFEGVVVHCHTGCTTEDICAALDLTPRDLFDKPHERPERRQVARYPYTDAEGTVLFTKIRWEPKTFTVTPPGVAGKLPTKPLYRLPDVVAAIEAGQPVYVVEGEKDADRLHQLGQTATCNYEGAPKPGSPPKWRPEYTEALTGATVIVIADRDEAGYTHARHIRDALTGHAESVKVWQPAAGNDISDHLDAGLDIFELEPADLDNPLTDEVDGGHTTEHEEDPELEWAIQRERLRRTARRILDDEEAAADFREPTYTRTLTDELAIPDEPITYTIKGLMPHGSNAVLAAQFKTGKTTLVNNLAKSLADHEPFLGRFDVAQLDGRIAIWNYEVDHRLYRSWLRETRIEHTDLISVLNLRGFRMPVQAPYVEEWTVNWLRQHEIVFWIVDPLARAYVGTSENDNSEVGRFLDTLDVIKHRAGVADLFLPTHTGRERFDEGEERARGATRIDDWTDVRWLLTKDAADNRYFRATGRDVDVEEELLIYDEPGGRTLRLGGGNRSWERKRRIEERAYAAIKEQPGITGNALRADVRHTVPGGARNEDIDAAVVELERAHRVRVIRPEKRGAATRHYTSDLTVLEGPE